MVVSRWILAGAAALVLCTLSLTIAFGSPTRDAVAELNAPGVTTSLSVAWPGPARDTDPCGPPGQELAARLLGINAEELYPGERYPTTGSCVFWSRLHPADFAILQVDEVGSDLRASSCAPGQVTQHRHVDLSARPASLTACTTP